MRIPKTNNRKWWILFIIAFFISLGGLLYYVYFYTPKNSLELYQAISFADDFEEARQLTLEGHQDNFKKEDFDFINRLDTNADSVGQFTLIEYGEKTYVIMTSTGTPRLKILAVEELPTDIRNYFIELSK